MKKLMAVSAVALLTACGPATSDESKIGTYIGMVSRYASAYEFRTPSGAFCVKVYAHNAVAVSCDFSGVEK